MRDEIVKNERATTLMDFVYELRCRANYRSIDEYAVDVDDATVVAFHDGLRHVLDLGVLSYEGQIARHTGVDALRTEFDAWASKVETIGDWATEPGRRRIDALAAFAL
ncbi:MAG: hypothetical protein ACRCXL_06900 [Dermatophilaceae bacterium]